jgi:acetyl-CoA acetyltransferase
MHTNRIAITGIGETEVGETPDMSSLDLHAVACRGAVADAGLEKDDLDGVLTGYSVVSPELMHSTVLADRLGLQPNFNASVRVGGASPYVAAAHAASAIRQGQCENVVVAFADNRRTGWSGAGVNELASRVGHPEFEHPYGPTIPSMYALLARKHMATHGTTPEQLAEVLVACRAHAAMRGAGQRASETSVEEVLASEPIAEPLHRPECALVSDCGGAFVVSGESTARSAPDPVELVGYGEGTGSEYVIGRRELARSQAERSGETAFEKAGLEPSDVDVAQLYDCFSITPLMVLEDLGFCEKGEGGEFVEERGISVDGELPINTHGGELAYAGSGVFHITEAVRQIRGEAGPTQIEGARTALAHGVGGVLSTNATLLLEVWDR